MYLGMPALPSLTFGAGEFRFESRNGVKVGNGFISYKRESDSKPRLVIGRNELQRSEEKRSLPGQLPQGTLRRQTQAEHRQRQR